MCILVFVNAEARAGGLTLSLNWMLDILAWLSDQLPLGINLIILLTVGIGFY